MTDTTGIDFSATVIAYPEPLYQLLYENGTTNNNMMHTMTRNAVNNYTVHFSQTVTEESDYGTYYLVLQNLLGKTTIFVNIVPQSKCKIFQCYNFTIINCKLF